MPTKFFTLSTVTQRIEALLRPALNARFWIKAEISSGRERSGAFYCDLVESNAEGAVIAQLRCTLWARDLERIRRSFGEAGLELNLADGTVVGMECRVQFHPRYGLSLAVLDMDPAVALGELELRRRRILASLEADGLLERNRALPLPLLPARIGLITSRRSAACEDFCKTLLQSGFGFEVWLADSSVQGVGAEAGILRALERLEALRVDLIVIARGGGSKTDLAWLDNEPIARRIAACSIPVWTGIGHEIDTSVLDAVAGRACLTPTAVAEELLSRFEAVSSHLAQARTSLRSVWRLRVEAVRVFGSHARMGLRQGTRKLLAKSRSDLNGRAQELRGLVGERLGAERAELTETRHRVRAAGLKRLAAERLYGRERVLHLAKDARRLVAHTRSAFAHVRSRLDRERVLRRIEQELGALAQRARALRGADPLTALARGFSLTYTAGGQLVRSVADVSVGQATLTRVGDGQIEAQVRKILEGDDDEEDQDRRRDEL